MRKVSCTIADVKKRIQLLQGIPLKMRINCGRKKIIFKSGVITSVYPSVFTVEFDCEDKKTCSYSYSDVLCGDVMFKRI